MSIFQMSISAAILILVIVVIRALAVHKLPKKTFLLFWGLMLFRLLIPFSIPMPLGMPSLIDRTMELIMDTTQTTGPYIGTLPTMPLLADISEGMQTSLLPSIRVAWAIGMAGLAMFFFVTHLRCRREYRTALPLENDYVNRWLNAQKLRRTIQVKFSDMINTPMTYGIFKPVILFPKNTDWQNKANLRYVLAHELAHIRQFDILTKWLLAAVLCIHWFNPMVWVMYVLANRDIEAACDETVVRTFGETTKSAYAFALIAMEESRSIFSPIYTNFAKNAINERINAIMKLKKRSMLSIILAAVLVSALVIGTLVVSAQTDGMYQDYDTDDYYPTLYVPEEIEDEHVPEEPYDYEADEADETMYFGEYLYPSCLNDRVIANFEEGTASVTLLECGTVVMSGFYYDDHSTLLRLLEEAESMFPEFWTD
ncbi:MAG: M56 family metallopeptidase [Defluviitaleaceae bacterium]|nr:M56 family metallopeptidase [Defluviitaleaceae bacterium]